MGRRKQNAPRHGSLAYLPRGRAERFEGRIRFWPEISSASPKLLGFSGYKVGMSNSYVTGDRRGSPTFGQEVNESVTLIETPPMVFCGIRAYSNVASGRQALTEVWNKDQPKGLDKLFSKPKYLNIEASMKKMEENLDKTVELRAILSTQPYLSSTYRKKPELFEVKLGGGTVKDQFSYLVGELGKEIRVSDVFRESQLIDIIGITKGKGIQGPVKRMGVKKLPHKSRKTVRGVGTLGAWTPHFVMYTVPRAGQMGFHQRTEINKQILKINKDAEALAPTGGFTKYGIVKTDYIVLKGSIPGPAKRLVKLRYSSRPPSVNIEAVAGTQQVEVQASTKR
ncbi:MAG: large subunit ribosomal protein [Thermoproteota archaeon]|nr:large subunit ribosomal protein [Thermoproteota archaeon]